MMKNLLVLFFICGCASPLISQNHNNIWMTGYASFNGGHFGITIYDFSADTLEIKRDDYSMSFAQTHGVMCDSAGKLLFYTNGMYIANAEPHKFIEAGWYSIHDLPKRTTNSTRYVLNNLKTNKQYTELASKHILVK